MRFRIALLGALAVFASYLVFSLPLAAATDVNIMFNGRVQETAKYEQEKLVNMLISVKHDSSDITWTNVKLAVSLNSASLAHSITKIYLYKCRTATPTECVRSTPQVFDNYVDAELLWKDMSDRTGSSQYPQTGNLLFLIKLEDTAGKENWVGLFTQTRRSSYNVFDTSQLNINSIELHAKSLDMAGPIKSYIENKMMVPFRWVTKAVFTGSSTLYGMGASSQEIGSHQFSTAVVSSDEIASINKDFYFVAPKTSSGIANLVTLNLNPSFTCGNGFCESDIGETAASCCLDCGCPAGQFCDVPANANLSTCKSDSIGLTIVSASSPPVSDCTRGFNAGISVRVSNPPTSLDPKLSGAVLLNKTLYSIACTGSSGSYECSVPLTSNIKCGGGSYTIGPGLLNLTLAYKDGSNQVSKPASTAFSGISVSFDCRCDEGSYCDGTKQTCQSEGPITLGITYLTNWLEQYNPGDRIYLRAKVYNPPAGLVLVDKSATMNLTNGQVSPGAPECSVPNSQFEYNCSIPFQISGYSNERAYTFSPNTLYFSISYDDGPLKKTKTISAPFGPVSIPSQACGDAKCNMGESQQTCCLDCGCGTDTSLFCDKVNGCQRKDSVTLSVNAVYPSNFTDCRESHASTISLSVNNPPTDMRLDYFAYLQGGLVKGWNLQCDKSAVNMLNCTLVIPPLESEGCSLPYKVVGPNSLNMTVSFPDGKSRQVTRQLSTGFENLLVIPVYHCGDGQCESSLGEDASNCCFDCACKNSSSFGTEYFCDFDQETKLGGCLPKSRIRLVIDTPTAPVNLDSCELSNSVNIKAHIENQPRNMRPEYFYATLNGTASKYIYCSPEQTYQSANYTFNCTLLVPRLATCHQGDTYTYEPNSLSALISFNNNGGSNKPETQTLSAALPSIVTRQGIRTLYDIIQDSKARTRQRINDLRQVISDLIDSITSCYEQVKMIIYATLIAAVVVGIWSYTNYQTPQSGGNNPVNVFIQGQRNQISGAVTDASLTAAAGSSIAQAWAKLCEALQVQYQIAIKSLEIEQKLDQMETCFEVQQHEMDIGRCSGQEQSCFNSMISCVNFNAISNIANEYSNIVREGSNDLNQMSQAFNNAANYASRIGGYGYGYGYGSGGYESFQVTCDGYAGDSCCGCTSQTTLSAGTTCRYSQLSFATTNLQNCVGKYILVDMTNYLESGANPVVLAYSGTPSFRGDNQNMFDDRCHTFSLYCDADNNGRFSLQSDRLVSSYQMKLLKCESSGTNVCKCIKDKSTVQCSTANGKTASPGTSGSKEAVLENQLVKKYFDCGNCVEYDLFCSFSLGKNYVKSYELDYGDNSDHVNVDGSYSSLDRWHSYSCTDTSKTYTAKCTILDSDGYTYSKEKTISCAA